MTFCYICCIFVRNLNAMRKILFKAKTVENGKWVEGYFSVDKFGNHIISDINVYTNKLEVNLIDRKTLCEFTGVYDKHGDRIFDGDIDTNGYVVSWCVDRDGWAIYDIESKNKECLCYYHRGRFEFNDIDFDVVNNIHNILII